MAHSNSPQDLRLIEDYLLIEAISGEASREKSVRKGGKHVFLLSPDPGAKLGQRVH